jgi:hypothetical protein
MGGGAHRASRSSIVLAAICAVLAQRTGYQELVLPMLSSNRFERHLSRYVGTLAQGCIATVDVSTGSFDALVRQTWTSVIEACRHGRYDAFERVAVGERIEHERGLRFSYEPLFNSLVAESWSAFNARVECRLEQMGAGSRSGSDPTFRCASAKPPPPPDNVPHAIAGRSACLAGEGE